VATPLVKIAKDKMEMKKMWSKISRREMWNEGEKALPTHGQFSTAAHASGCRQ